MQTPPTESPWAAGLAAARVNAVPGAMIQSMLLVVLLAYWWHAPTQSFLTQVTQWKSAYGYLFTFILVSFAGAVVPEAFRILYFQRGRAGSHNLRNLAFGIPFWGMMGICADTLYWAQAIWFGSEASPGTVLLKMAVDQFIYTPLFGTAAIVWAYEWRSRGFAVGQPWYAFSSGFYRNRVLPAVIAGWGVWIPAITLVYCLPTQLQLPVSAFATCFWSLLVVYMQAHARS